MHAGRSHGAVLLWVASTCAPSAGVGCAGFVIRCAGATANRPGDLG